MWHRCWRPGWRPREHHEGSRAAARGASRRHLLPPDPAPRRRGRARGAGRAGDGARLALLPAAAGRAGGRRRHRRRDRAARARGHEEGGEPAGRRRDFGYADLVDDLDRAVTTLAARLPGAPIHLLGHSLGGQLAAVEAAARPERLAGLIHVASGTPYWRVFSPRMLAMTQLVPLIARLLGHFPGDRFGFAGREARTQMTDWARLARTGRFVFGRPRRDHGRAMASTALPVLSVSLEGDELAPPASVDDLAGRFPSAHVERVHLDPVAMGFAEVDHLRWARHPGVIVPTLTDWLARVHPRP
ncbi:alpha/beta fold hydrolase [Nocardioides sp. dk884]|uniref:alpha/beta fold hydrolase n=1 Tax=Nocardioides sp. dk884 TaxID=2662361 RepID=UPI001E3B0766|nr:alpha/beta fold hydrolase [Nocardioides sp. dk884]